MMVYIAVSRKYTLVKVGAQNWSFKAEPMTSSDVTFKPLCRATISTTKITKSMKVENTINF